MNRLTNNDIRQVDAELYGQVSQFPRFSVEQRRETLRIRDRYRTLAAGYGVERMRDCAEAYRVWANRAQILLDELNEEVRGVHKRI